MKRLLLSLVSAVVLTMFALPAHAQATRTWISGVGDDANPCSRTAPCKTWAGAISKTAAGGEIDALDPGGFGALTITKSITLDGGGGQVASTLVSGTPGFTVAAAATDVVILRNIRINGVLNTGSAGTNGVSFVSGGALIIENCAIFGFGSAGVNVTTSASAVLNILNSTITNAVNGINFATTGGTLNGEMDHTTIQKMSSNGITTSSTSSVAFTVTNSNILNTAGVAVNSGGANTVLGVDSSSVSNNNTGFKTNGGTIRISRNVLYDNNTNFTISGGTIATTGDNVVAVNGATTPNGTVTHQ